MTLKAYTEVISYLYRNEYGKMSSVVAVLWLKKSSNMLNFKH